MPTIGNGGGTPPQQPQQPPEHVEKPGAKPEAPIMFEPTRLPLKVGQIIADRDRYLGSFENDMVQLKDADVNTWQALASRFLIAMGNASQLAAECYFAKEWYSARGDVLKDELKKREGELYDILKLEKVAASARSSQLKIATGKDEGYMQIRNQIAKNSQVIAEFAALEIRFKAMVNQADNAHVSSRMAGKRDSEIMVKE